MIVYGGLLVLMMLFQPQGILGSNSVVTNLFGRLFNVNSKKSVVK
jgi:hypothetical protein